MEIRNSTKNDINKILKLYKDAREFMKANGNPEQWKDDYPNTSLVESDIENNISYVCIDEGEIAGVFMYLEGKEPTYEKIYEGEWINDKPYGVVHRIASAKGKKGVATFCLEWCFNKCGNLRIDTHRDNIPMQNLLNKIGFTKCGIIYLEDGDERIAYQRTKGSKNLFFANTL